MEPQYVRSASAPTGVQEKLLLSVCCIDTRGELLDTHVMLSHNDATIALHHLWNFVVKNIPHTPERWRVVVGRFTSSAFLDSTELLEWEHLLKDIATSPDQLAACHVSDVILTTLEPDSPYTLTSKHSVMQSTPEALIALFTSAEKDFAINLMERNVSNLSGEPSHPTSSTIAGTAHIFQFNNANSHNTLNAIDIPAMQVRISVTNTPN